MAEGSQTNRTEPNLSELQRELVSLERSEEALADLVGNTLLSVLRDLGIGSEYGNSLHQLSASNGVPAFADIFQPKYRDAIARELSPLEFVKVPNFLLYTHQADLIGILSRLLIIARETADLKNLIGVANRKIDRLNVDVKHMSDTDFVRHMRNAMAHSRVYADVNHEDFSLSRIIFLDGNPRTGSITARLSFTSSQLMEAIRIIINCVYIPYLREVGWVVCD